MGRATGDFANVEMLAKRVNQRGCNWTLILVYDWKNDTFVAVAGLGGRSDDHYYDDRDDEQRDEPKVVTAYEPEVLKHHHQRLQAYTSPPGLSSLRHISARIIREPRRPSSGETGFRG